MAQGATPRTEISPGALMAAKRSHLLALQLHSRGRWREARHLRLCHIRPAQRPGATIEQPLFLDFQGAAGITVIGGHITDFSVAERALPCCLETTMASPEGGIDMWGEFPVNLIADPQ